MPVRSIFQWRLILENIQPWNAAEFLLRDLHDYALAHCLAACWAS